MRAILVSVDYADLLTITLPHNRHHFSEVWVVTSGSDRATQDIAVQHGAKLHVTSAFYQHGAVFNKWAALEEGLDAMGRHGWICLLDADILWPKHIIGETTGLLPWLVSGYLYTPIRRMYTPLALPFPPEDQWGRYPIHPNTAEYAGYSQIFHASDPALPPKPPWHQTNWIHAGGADSFFQERWSAHHHPTGIDHRVRPPFEVLHLGSAGVNWFGRASDYLDGSRHELAAQRLTQVASLWKGRRGKSGDQRFHGERM